MGDNGRRNSVFRGVGIQDVIGSVKEGCMSISPVGPNLPITRLQGSTATESVQGSQDVSAPATDTVEISDSARYLSELKKLPDVRTDKVQNARELIASGQYETPERIDGTVNRLLQELF